MENKTNEKQVVGNKPQQAVAKKPEVKETPKPATENKSVTAYRAELRQVQESIDKLRKEIGVLRDKKKLIKSKLGEFKKSDK